LKRLEDILKTVKFKTKSDVGNVQVSGITTDSRKAKKNFLFIAYAGINSNGHDYIDQAVKNGEFNKAIRFVEEAERAGSNKVRDALVDAMKKYQ